MASGGKIADFFAKVGFKVDTQELKKVETHLTNMSKSFKKVAHDFDRASKKIQLALDKLNIKRTAKKPFKKAVSPDDSKFDAKAFFSKESNIRNVLGLTQKQRKAIERLALAYQRSEITTAQANARLKNQIALRKRANTQIKVQERRINKLNFAQIRAIGSAKQLVGAFASVYTAVEAIGAIKRTGQDLESARAGMLAASDGTQGLAKDLAFVDKQAVRLGLDLAATTKDFVKLRAVSKDISDEDLQDIFLGVAEAGTVLQLTADDMKGALRAVQQMMSKGKVNAEDFRQQLAERLPVAFKALEKATGLSGTALEKAMKDGKLLAEDVLPKLGRELRKVADTNDALTKILQTSRVAENRFTTALQKLMDIIFQAGFGDALTTFFNTSTEFIKKMSGLGKFLGQVFKFAIEAVSGALAVLSVPLGVLSDIFETIDLLSTSVSKKFDTMSGSVFPKLAGAIGIVAVAMALLNRRMLLISTVVTGVLATVLEIVALTTKGVQGAIERNLLGPEGDIALGEEGSFSTLGGAYIEGVKERFLDTFGFSDDNKKPNVKIDKVEIYSNPDSAQKLTDDIMQEAAIGGL